MRHRGAIQRSIPAIMGTLRTSIRRPRLRGTRRIDTVVITFTSTLNSTATTSISTATVSSYARNLTIMRFMPNPMVFRRIATNTRG
uniref:Uncharacterized protein n=1 Tax=Picea glauca TaxID=3330 RepID=A0A101LVG3_PICGL|nr:hypothetical protein ABT39_MTgene1895 [Picea glauca]QHR92536.1 hypothetical protein Q903MT_gene6582 [Picea sitchensis]